MILSGLTYCKDIDTEKMTIKGIKMQIKKCNLFKDVDNHRMVDDANKILDFYKEYVPQAFI